MTSETLLPVARGERPTDLPVAARRLGCPWRDPFLTLAFRTLPVLPSPKITDQGLVDGGRFGMVSLFPKLDGFEKSSRYGLRIPKNKAYLRYAAMTRATRSADI